MLSKRRPKLKEVDVSVVSDRWEWVGDRYLLGDIKISPWKFCYHLGIKVPIVLTSISKKVSPGGNQS